MTEDKTIELIKAAKEGDSAAWNRLDERLRKTLRLAVRGQVPLAMRAQFDTEVVLQSALAAAFLSLDSYEYQGEGSLTAWLRTIFRNKLTTRVRSLRSKKRDVGCEVSSTHADQVSPVEQPDEQTEKAEQYARVVSALASLPAAQSSLLTAHFFDKRSATEIAAQQKLSEKTVRRRIALSLESLRYILRSE